MPCGRPPTAADQPGSEAPGRRDELLDALRSEGPQREDAVRELHALLLRAARFEVRRRPEAVASVRGEELEDLAHQAADDALVAVLGKLDDYRGHSRFTTWAYKFALLEAGVRLRRRAWQHREVVLAADAWPPLASEAGPELYAEQGELLGAVQRLIGEALTSHQRHVLVTLAVEGVPIDVLAERLDTTRGALYKTLHDARSKLRAALGQEGLSLDLLDP